MWAFDELLHAWLNDSEHYEVGYDLLLLLNFDNRSSSGYVQVLTQIIQIG